MPYNRCYTLSHASRLFVLGSIILLGLAMSSCASSDDPTSQGVGTEDISSNTNTGVALNHINANVLQTSVQGFTRGAVQEDTATPDNTPTASDGGLTCDVTWGAPGTTRASDTGYTYQFSEIGSAIGSASRIAIQPRNYAAANYTYNVSTTGTISATTPYYFETANNDVITSWYPYSANLSSFTVQTDQSTLSKYIASDLLYTSVVVPTTTHSLTYSHKMAQIIVDVTVSNATYLTNSTIQSLTISNLQTKCTPNFTTSGNTVSAPSFAASSTAATVTAYRKSSTSTTAEFFLCVPAQTITSSNIFTVTVGGTAYTGKLTNSQTLSSGSAYNISITIDGKATMVYPSGSIAVGDYYGIAANGQAVVVKNASISSASSKGITPIAVVFYLGPTTKDRANGWTHAYAMSLKISSKGCVWSTETSATVQNSSHTGKANYTSHTFEYTAYTSAMADLDGYEATHNITDAGGSYTAATYPAFFSAVNFALSKPKSSSGWYLPTVGQWWEICVNLGGVSRSATIAAGSTGDWSTLSGADFCWTNLNNYVNAANGDEFVTSASYEAGKPQAYCYWTSNERNATKAPNFDLRDHQGQIYIYYSSQTTTKNNRNLYVRPVIAF